MLIKVKDLGMPKGQFSSSVLLDQNSQELAQATTLGNPPSSEPPQLDDHPEGPQQQIPQLIISDRCTWASQQEFLQNNGKKGI